MSLARTAMSADSHSPSSRLTSNAGARAGVLTTLKASVADFRAKGAARHENASAMAALATLDDAALGDMGISRGEIEHIVLNGKR